MQIRLWKKTYTCCLTVKSAVREDLLEFAKRNNIKEAAEIIDRIAEASSRWPLMAKESEVPKPMIDAIVPNLILSI